MLKLKLGTKGELVIPKKVREYVGLSRGKPVLLELEGKSIRIRTTDDDIVKRWEEFAKRHRVDVSKWTYGDKLYEEVFDVPRR